MTTRLLTLTGPRHRSLRRDLLLGALLAAAYWLAVLLGLRWAVLPGLGTPVWPAAGIAFAGLVLGGSRLWPAIVVGRLAGALTVGTPLPFWADGLVAVATMLGAFIPARLVELSGRPLRRSLGSMRDMAWLTFGGGFLGAVISATLGIGALWLGGMPAERLPYAWLNWWFGFFVGTLTLGPLILSWTAPGAVRMTSWQWSHLLLCLGATVLLSALVFLREESVMLRTWHVLPVLVWAALAFNVRGISAALAITSAFAIAGAMNGTGPLAAEGEEAILRVLLAQQFIAMNALTLLFLAAIAEERRDVEALGRLAAIVSSSPEAMLSLDREGRILSWNGGAEQLFGWRAEEVLGHSYDTILPPSEQGHSPGVIRALRGETVREETVRVARDGTSIAVLVTRAPVRAPDGSILGVASVIRDIRARKAAEAALQRLNESLEQRVAERTRDLEEANATLRAQVQAREEAEAQLRQAQKMEAVGQLTGGIAHDFNNMLTVVIGSLDMARRRGRDLDPKVASLIDYALEGANRAARLTARLLAFSRQQPLAPEPTDVNHLVLGMSELLRRTIGERHRIETHLPDGIWPIFADPHQLENAILNLAVNARDAMPEGGLLTIQTANVEVDAAAAAAVADARPGAYVMVAVTDTGTGMPPEVLARAFDPFFTTKETGKGTGLGLSMVYGFVQQSRGHVRIESDEGRGTAVRLYLPRWAGQARGPSEREAQPPEVPGTSPEGTVLVVEDDPEVRRLSVQMLGDLGYRVIEATDPDVALGIVEREPGIRLLFTDVVMPDIDGRRLAELARKLRPELRVLLTTGYTRDLISIEDGAVPGIALLPKPFTLAQLAAKLRETLG
jgi:PAS domain S-box-containing protein